MLDGKCYHMLSVLASNNKKDEAAFWSHAMDGKVTKEEWIQFLEGRGYRAGVDYPFSLFYK